MSLLDWFSAFGVLGAFDRDRPEKVERETSERIVREAYLEVLRREPDAAAEAYVVAVENGRHNGSTLRQSLRRSAEFRAGAAELVRKLYRELLLREPDVLAAESWIECQVAGRCDEASIRRELEASEEHKRLPKFSLFAKPQVDENVLVDRESGRARLGVGSSLFYAMAVPWEQFTATVDGLARAGVDFVRFAGSTFGWDQDRPAVVPFAPGRMFEGRSNEPDPTHFDELDRRLDYCRGRGITVQYTVLWGGFQPLFVRHPNIFAEDIRTERGQAGPLHAYVHYVASRLSRHPAHTIEIMNEVDHGHHLGFLSRGERKDFLEAAVDWITAEHPKAVITASDGGNNPEAEGAPYFAYHDAIGLDYWNVHFPRDVVLADGIPRWARGVYHLHEERERWRASKARMPGQLGGYGRNDENIFFQSREEHDRWPYGGATGDADMYGLMLWTSVIASSGPTIHTQKGFFCEPDAASDEVFRYAGAIRKVTERFSWRGARTVNAGWHNSPIPGFNGGIFKAHALVAADSSDMLVVVLNPRSGLLGLDLPSRMRISIHDPRSGDMFQSFTRDPGQGSVRLPASPHENLLVLRLTAEP